jgi:hypothetical protein
MYFGSSPRNYIDMEFSQDSQISIPNVGNMAFYNFGVS